MKNRMTDGFQGKNTTDPWMIPKAKFYSILKSMSSQHAEVNAGKMMSSPGITFRKKVFTFLYHDSMVFKLGKDRDLKKEYGIDDYALLNPFKNRPPMKGWYVISKENMQVWGQMAKDALHWIS